MPIYRCKRCGCVAGELPPPRCPVCRGRRFDDFRKLKNAPWLTWPPSFHVAVVVAGFVALLFVVHWLK
jgi:rubredoxin